MIRTNLPSASMMASISSSALFSSPNSTMQKEYSPSHQNVGTCMEY
jgi:hypothetical protein